MKKYILVLAILSAFAGMTFAENAQCRSYTQDSGLTVSKVDSKTVRISSDSVSKLRIREFSCGTLKVVSVDGEPAKPNDPVGRTLSPWGSINVKLNPQYSVDPKNVKVLAEICE